MSADMTEPVDAGLLQLAGVRIFEVDGLDERAFHVLDSQVLLLDAHLNQEDRRTYFEHALHEVTEPITLEEL